MTVLSTTLTIVLFFFLGFNFSTSTQAQTVLTVGIDKYMTQLRSIIEVEGYTIENVSYKDISATTLQDKEALTLFNLRQTWNQEQIFSAAQVDDILAFVQAGGSLYLSSRKGYENLLSPLGIDIFGVDGNQTGREWPLILESISTFIPHSLTEQLQSVATDVSGRFRVSSEWSILGTSSNQVPLLALRKWGLGKIILGSGERIGRDPRLTNNRYETDISKGSNYQYHVNLFAYLATPFNPSNATTKNLAEEVHVFPNPTTQMVYLQGEDISKIEVVASNGQLLKTILTQAESVQIDLHGYPKGLYWLKISTKSGIVTKEIVLQ